MFWCFESDDDHRNRKKKRQEAWNKFKRDVTIHGWRPGINTKPL